MAKKSKKNENLTLEDKLEQALIPNWDEPYKLPENWCWVKLGEIATFERGITFPAAAKEGVKTPKNIPCLRTANVQEYLDTENLLYVDKSYMKENEEKFVRENDIIMSTANSRELVGKTSFVYTLNEAMTFGGFIMAIRAKNINPKFLFYLLRLEFYNGKFMKNSTQTTNIANINTAILSECEVPLPPLNEQSRILECIENLFAQLDEAKEKSQEVIDGFENRKAAILHKAFTGELTAKWRNENGIHGTGEFNCVQIGTLTDITSSKRIYKEEYVGEGVPFFRSTEVVELHDYGATTPEFYISRERYNEISSNYGVPKKGDLLVTSVGTIGKTWIADDREFYYKDGNLTQVKQCSSLDMKYLQYYIESQGFKNQVNDTVAGSAYNALTIVKFKKIVIPLPEIAEQKAIVDILESLISKEQQVKEMAESVVEQIDTIKKSILARAFHGELGTNNPDEESAIALLKQIL